MGGIEYGEEYTRKEANSPTFESSKMSNGKQKPLLKELEVVAKACAWPKCLSSKCSQSPIKKQGKSTFEHLYASVILSFLR
jgi:hypothetical protein